MSAPIVLFLALAASVPRLDYQKSCRAGQSAAAQEDQANTYQSCLRDEEAARKQLQQSWNRIRGDYRQSCTDEASGLSPSYVELLTCLEMRSGGNFSGGAGLTPGTAAGAPATGSSAPQNPLLPNAPNSLGATRPLTPGTPGSTTTGTTNGVTGAGATGVGTTGTGAAGTGTAGSGSAIGGTSTPSAGGTAGGSAGSSGGGTSGGAGGGGGGGK